MTGLIRLTSLITMVLAPAVVLASEGGGHGGGLVTFIGTVVNFLILAYLLIRPLKRMLSDRLMEKHRQIRTTLEEAEKEIAEAKQRLEKYTRLLGDLPAEIAALRAEATEELDKEKQQLTADLEATRQRIEEYAKELVDQEVKKAKLILRREMADRISAGAKEILRRKMEPGRDKTVVAAALQELESRK